MESDGRHVKSLVACSLVKRFTRKKEKTMRRLVVLALTLAIIGLVTIFACDKSTEPVKSAEVMSVDYYTADDVYRGVKWLDPSTGAILSTKWHIDDQEEFEYALDNYAHGDTFECDTAGDTLTTYANSGTSMTINNVIVTTTSSPYASTRYYLKSAYWLEVTGFHLQLITSYTGTAGWRVGNLGKWQFIGGDENPVIFSGYTNCTDSRKLTISDVIFCDENSSAKGWPYPSGSLVEFKNCTIPNSESTTDGLWRVSGNGVTDLDDCTLTNGPPCDPERYVSYGTPDIVWHRNVIDGGTYDFDTAPTFSNYDLDGYDKTCKPTVSVSISFPNDEEDLVSGIYFDFGCYAVDEDTVQATYTAGKWRAKLDIVSLGCLTGDCEFIWRPRVVYCVGEETEATYLGGTCGHEIFCGICQGSKKK